MLDEQIAYLDMLFKDTNMTFMKAFFLFVNAFKDVRIYDCYKKVNTYYIFDRVY